MSKKSHIQMPRLILKNFQKDSKGLFYYDCTQQKIVRGHAKTLCTEMGYYSNDVEIYLDKNVETCMGNLVDFLKRTSFQDGDNPPKNYKDVAFTYCYALISRSPELLSEMKNNLYIRSLSVVNQHDIVARRALELAKEEDILGFYKIAFLINNTEEELVLPIGGIVQWRMRLICPVSPWRAIVFYVPIAEKSDKNVNIITLFEIDSKDTIKDINIEAVKQEEKRNKIGIVASKKDILIDLLENAGVVCEEY